MKESKQYSDNLSKFWKKVKPKNAVETPKYADPSDAMVFAVLLEKFGTAKAEKYIKKFNSNFVDWNDVRVSRDEEIIEVLGGESDLNNYVAANMRNSLQAVFERNDCLELNYIIEFGKRKAFEELEKMKVLTDFVLNYIMLVCLDSHSIPVNEKMAEFLKSNEIVHEDSSIEDIKSFLERQIPAAQNYQFFASIIELSEKGLCAVAKSRNTVKKVLKEKTAGKTAKKKSK